MIVAGLEPATSGTVLIDGLPVTGPGLDRGVVFQSYTLLPWLTALGNVEFALRAAGESRAKARALAEEHLALVGLSDFADAYPVQLSGGMKQRVAIARALSYRPKMLVMDEPFGALDALTRQHMQELLAHIWERHRLTVLFVTHDVEEAVYMSDRVAVMTNRPGRIKSIVLIDLPRPRNIDMIGTPAFAAATAPGSSRNKIGVRSPSRPSAGRCIGNFAGIGITAVPPLRVALAALYVCGRQLEPLEISC